MRCTIFYEMNLYQRLELVLKKTNWNCGGPNGWSQTTISSNNNLIFLKKEIITMLWLHHNICPNGISISIDDPIDSEVIYFLKKTITNANMAYSVSNFTSLNNEKFKGYLCDIISNSSPNEIKTIFSGKSDNEYEAILNAVENMLG